MIGDTIGGECYFRPRFHVFYRVRAALHFSFADANNEWDVEFACGLQLVCDALTRVVHGYRYIGAPEGLCEL